MTKKTTRAGEKWKNHFSLSFKMQIVDEIASGRISQNQAAKKYGISRYSLSFWIAKYGSFNKKLRDMGGKTPKQEINELRAKLRAAESENQVWRTVMQIIREEYGEESIKKYIPESLIGTKKSKKKE